MHSDTGENWYNDCREARDALHDHQVGPQIDEDMVICECFCVSVADIKLATQRGVDLDPKSLGLEFGMGTGCGQCIMRWEQWKKLVLGTL